MPEGAYTCTMEKQFFSSPLKVALVVLVLSLAYSALFFDKMLDGTDEGQVLLGGKLISQGKLLYSEVRNIYTPGIFILGGALYQLFPQNQILAARVAMALFAAGAAALLYLISLRLLPRRYAIVPPALMLVWGISFQHYTSPTWPAVFFQLLAVYWVLRHEEQKKLKHLLAAGLATGMALLAKQNIGLYTLAGISLFYLLLAANESKWNAAKMFGSLWQRRAFFVAAAVIPLAAVAFFAGSGTLHDAYDLMVVRAQTQGSHPCWGMPFPGIDSLVPRGLSLEGIYRPAINSVYYAAMLAYAGALYWLYRSRKELSSPKHKALLLASLLAILQFHMVVFPRTDRNHLIFSLPLAYAIGVFLVMQLKENASKRGAGSVARLAFYAAVAYLAFFAVLGIGLTAYSYRDYFGPTERLAFAGVVVPKGQADDFMQAASYLREHTTENEKIFVASGAATMYLVADRPPAARYTQLYPGVTSAAAVQDEIIGDIGASWARYAVTSPLTRSDLCYITQYEERIYAYLDGNFAPEVQFGNFTIMARK